MASCPAPLHGVRETEMNTFSSRAILLVASCVFAASAMCKDESPAPDPKAVEIIHELGLVEAPAALRDTKGWRAPKRIVMATQNPNGTGMQEIRATLQGAAPGVEVVFVADAAGLVKEAPSADAIIGGDDIACDEQVLSAAKRVRWVAVMSAGVEACLGKPALERPGITVTNMRAVAGPVMAEHAIALMFALARSLQVSVGRQATGEGWNRNFAGSQPQALTGKTLLIAGLGGIGLEVAKRAHALGMKVIGTRNSSREGPEYVSRVGLADELPSMIAEADVVVAALPLVPATTHLFDAKMFARMKKSAFFISVGRGGSVVTDDLVVALNEGIIAGAGLDVTDPEPLPKDHPLWKAKNIIITPHMSALSDLGQAARMLILKEQLRRFSTGDKLLSVVDFPTGY
jgi:phosphoglycerate dehydrogenase-like enzyme